MTRVVRFLGVTALLCTLLPHVATAQDRRHPRWEIPGLDFRPDGVLRPYARAVRAARARLRAAGRFGELNASATAAGGRVKLSETGQASATAVTGVLKVPAILIRFKDSPVPTFTPADYNDVLFGATPTGAAAGRPYTYRSFYQQMSNGLFDIQGQTFPYVTLDSNEVYYTGGTSSLCQTQNPFGSTNCNGIWSGAAQARMQSALREAIRKIDPTVDFSAFVDPTTGFVPLVLFMHEAQGGECGPQASPQNHLWAHRFALSPDTTNDNDPFHAGKKVIISDYILQPAVGGATSCNTSQIMPIGTVAHETGHGFGLPDLYDNGGPSEGIGQWGLMSSGNFTSPFSPSRMEAWSLNELGWITLAPLTTGGTYSFDAAPLSDTAYYVTVQGSNPRAEYFLLENRQRQQSDSALIRIHCQKAGNPPGCGGGLLIFHIDQAKVDGSMLSNTVNSGPIHGVALMQADAFGNLDADASGGNFCPSNSIFLGCSDRGDAGDLFPGTTLNNAFIFRTNPAAVKNVDGSFAGFGIDSIQQLITDRTMSFRLRFGSLTIARGSDTTASILFDGTTFKVFRDLLDQGSSHTVDFTDGQLSPNGRTRFHWVSWSDAGAKNHTIIGSLAGGTLTATLGRDFLLRATSSAGGSVTADTAINLTTGEFVPEGRVVHLTPVDGSGSFCGWTGDSTTTDSVLTLSMAHPYVLSANFGSSAAITSAAARPAGIMGATYADTLRIAGGSPSVTWSVISGALPVGLSLSPGGVISGFPHQTGPFSYTAQVVSCDTQSRTFTMSVTAPTLATTDVTAQLLGPTSPLSADQVRYLDFLGNNNGGFDIGDFLAWVKATGAPLTAAVLQAMQQKGGPR